MTASGLLLDRCIKTSDPIHGSWCCAKYTDSLPRREMLQMRSSRHYEGVVAPGGYRTPSLSHCLIKAIKWLPDRSAPHYTRIESRLVMLIGEIDTDVAQSWPSLRPKLTAGLLERDHRTNRGPASRQGFVDQLTASDWWTKAGIIS